MKRENDYTISGSGKRRGMNRYFVRFFLLSFAVMATGFTTGSLASCAASGMQRSDSGEVSYKYYTSVQIAEGDSLQSIAKRYMTEEYKDTDTYLYEMMQINALDDETIHTGQFLIVPYYSGEIK